MEPSQETTSRRNRDSNTGTASSQAAPPTYGYHNTYHTHAQLPIGAPPSYARATDPKILKVLEEKARTEVEVALSTTSPPPYTCTIELSAVLGVRQELSSPFQVAGNREWYDAYIVLSGTQLSIHRVKQPGLLSKSRKPTPGRLLRSYTLQHAEVGVASDFKKTALIPKSPFAHLVPATARPKLYETDPHLFEPVREHAIRLRLETEQLLICAPNQDDMLNWTEALCAAVDISNPLEDRSEPRYRSLPRRSRRQRILDSAGLLSGSGATSDSSSNARISIDRLDSLEQGRRIIAQQEQIIRQLYPHLAATRTPGSATTSAELEIDEFDAEDVRFPTSVRPSSDSEGADSERQRKNVEHVTPTDHQIQRYRRRCAPVLLASSPRVSDVVFSEGKRMRISVKEHILVAYTSHPPRYDVHHFAKTKRSSTPTPTTTTTTTTSKIPPTTSTSVSLKHVPDPIQIRPGSPIRGLSDDSITSISSFDEELHRAPSASQSADDVSINMSGPGSPGLSGKGKEKLVVKRRVSEDGEETGMGSVTLGVGLIV